MNELILEQISILHHIKRGIENGLEFMKQLLVLIGNLIPGVLKPGHGQMIEPREDRKQRIEVLTLAANMSDLNELFNNAHTLDETRLVQDLVDHPEHLLVGEVGELGEVFGRRRVLPEQRINVLARLNGLEEAVVAKCQLSR